MAKEKVAELGPEAYAALEAAKAARIEQQREAFMRMTGGGGGFGMGMMSFNQPAHASPGNPYYPQAQPAVQPQPQGNYNMAQMPPNESQGTAFCNHPPSALPPPATDRPMAPPVYGNVYAMNVDGPTIQDNSNGPSSKPEQPE